MLVETNKKKIQDNKVIRVLIPTYYFSVLSTSLAGLDSTAGSSSH